MYNPLIDKFYELNPQEKPEEENEPEIEPKLELGEIHYDTTNNIFHIGGAGGDTISLNPSHLNQGITTTPYQHYAPSYSTYVAHITSKEDIVHIANELAEQLMTPLVNHILTHEMVSKIKIGNQEVYKVAITIKDS